ncbi:MAG: DNA-3-methyladenine glycosylase I [Candidatus Azotimanducaceae bacterium]
MVETFAKIYKRAAARKGGEKVLELMLRPVRESTDITRISDADVLAEMTKCVFRSGFVWKIIEAKWPGFQTAFSDFDVMHCAMLADEDLEVLQGNAEIVRHGKKIASVRANAQYILDVRADYGSFNQFLGQWPDDDFIGLWEHLKKNGSRLGGQTGRYFLRFLGYDTPMLSRDVVTALIKAGVVDKDPTSKKAQQSVQDAFIAWQGESKRSLQEISRVLALSTD